MTDSKKTVLNKAALAAAVFFALVNPINAAASSLAAKSMGSFTRIEISGAANSSVSKQGDKITITYPSANAPDPASLSSGFKHFAQSVTRSDDKKSLTIALNAEYKMRQFIGNRASGFDLFQQGPKKAPKEEAKTEPKPQTNLKTKTDAEEAALTPAAGSEEKSEDPAKEVAKEAAKEEPKKEPVKEEKKDTQKSEEIKQEKAESAKTPIEEKKVVIIEEHADDDTAETTASTAPDETKTPPLAPEAAPAKPEPHYAEPTTDDKLAPPASTSDEHAASFRQKNQLPEFREAKTVFGFPAKSTYAVYERSGNIYVFIDNPADESHASNDTAIDENSYPAEWLQASYGGTILYWAPMDSNTSVTTTRSEEKLEIDFTKDQNRKPFQAGIYSYQESGGQASALKINFLPPYSINKITDPTVGDNLLVISGEVPSAANKRQRGTVEMKVLKSYSGLAIVTVADDLTAEPMQDGILIKSPQPFISVKGLLVDSEKPGTRIELRQSFVPYADWEFPEGKNYITSRHENNLKFMNSPRESRPFFRLRGAQDFIATDMYSEALGLLKTIKPDTPEFYKKNRLAGLSGALNIFLGRYDEAAADLLEPEVKDLPEAQALSKFIALLTGKPEGDSFSFPEAYGSFISSYPSRMQKHYAETMLRALYRKGKLSQAEALLKYIKEEKMFSDADYQKKLVDYIDSKLTEAGGDITAATKIWEQLAADEKDREFRAKAAFELIRRAYINGDISRSDALQKYHNLRFTWREEDFEVPLLEAIANLSQEEKDYYNTLEAMRYMVTYYPDNEISKNSIPKMTTLFLNLFNSGGVGKMNPLDALTLYYEFRELTPLGEAGDEMIRNLADRLMEVDLLDRASALLTHQIRFRLEGLPRAQVATRLALIHILNNKPQNAIEVLDFSKMDSMPADLVESRKFIRAQALSDLKKYHESLEILAGDTSEKAKALRIETMWNGKMWDDVAKEIEPQLAAAAESGKPFGETQEHNLIRLAVAYILNANAKAASELEQKYGKYVTSKDLRTELQFLASDPEGVDHNSMDKLSGAINEFQSFMDNFRKQVKDQGLSKAVP